MTHSQRIEMYLREGRTVSGGKGDSTVKQSETDQAAFNQQLMSAFKTQFANQGALTSFLSGKLQSQINNPTGLDAATKAAENTSVIDNSATSYQNALKAEQAGAAAHGGEGLPSGVQEQIQGQLAGQEANSQAAGELAVQQQDADLKNSNYWKAVGGLTSDASLENPLGYGSDATAGSSAVAGLSAAETASQQSQLLGALGGIAGGAGTAAAGFWKNN